jgi:transcription antitermination factor NusG
MRSNVDKTLDDCNIMPLGWYAAYTRHQHEKSAAQILQEKGFDALLPLYQVAHRWKDRTQMVRLPVFPCYVFVRASLQSRLKVLQTPGICQLVGFAGQPTAIPECEMDSLRALVKSSARYEPHPYLHSGDCVQIKYGPLAGIEGILTRFKNQYRVVLSVQLLQQSVAVEVDLAGIERTASAQIPASLATSPSKCIA